MGSAKRSVIVSATRHKDGDLWRLRIRIGTKEWNADVSDKDYRVRRLEEKIISEHNLPEEVLKEYRYAVEERHQENMEMD